jgi:hypothetical protein
MKLLTGWTTQTRFPETENIFFLFDTRSIPALASTTLLPFEEHGPC